jgi:iron(III) transport system substrate-binding protein
MLAASNWGIRMFRPLISVLAACALLSPVHVLAQAAAKPADPETWKRTVAAGVKEGVVVFYSAAGPATLARIKVDFEKANPGIVVEASRYFGAGLVSRLEQERKSAADGADVVISTELNWFEAIRKEGQMKAPVGPSVANWPSSYLVQGAIVAVSVEPLIMIYNTNLVKTPLTGYEDLLKSEFKGKFGIPEVVATTLLAWYDWLEKTRGPEFIGKLAAQQPRRTVSTPVAAQATAAGEFMAHPFVALSSALPLIKGGAPLKVVYPKPSFGIRYVGGILGWTKHPNAAQVFMDYLMSVRGQTVWNGEGDAASPLNNIPGSLDAKNITPYDPTLYNNDMLNAYREKFDKMFK